MLPKNRQPTHAGEMLLKEFLEPMGLTQKDFANHLGWTYAKVNEIVNGKRGVSPDAAIIIGDALNTGPEFWLNLQQNWDLWNSLKKRRKKVKPLLGRVASFL